MEQRVSAELKQELCTDLVRILRNWLFYAEQEERLAVARMIICSTEIPAHLKDGVIDRLSGLIDEIRLEKEEKRWLRMENSK